MRKTTLVLNTIVVVFFLGFLAYTHFARQHLEALARDFVTEKTLQYSAPVVAFAEGSLDSPLAKKLLSKQQTEAIRQEIAVYHRDPPGYIADLTRQKQIIPKLKHPNPLFEKVALFKEAIRKYYDDTLSALIADLRIFSISNLVAGLIAWSLAYRSREHVQKSVVWFSFLMFFAVLLCTSMYIDDLTFFRILFRTHMGWWYPVFLCIVLYKLHTDYGDLGKSEEPPETSEPHRGSAAEGEASITPRG